MNSKNKLQSIGNVLDTKIKSWRYSLVPKNNECIFYILAGKMVVFLTCDRMTLMGHLMCISVKLASIVSCPDLLFMYFELILSW